MKGLKLLVLGNVIIETAAGRVRDNSVLQTDRFFEHGFVEWIGAGGHTCHFND